MQHTYQRGLFDRYDGWRIRNVDPLFNLIPFLLRTRLDSQNLFEESIPVEGLERFIRAHREDIPDLSYMHIIIGAMVRLLSQKPYLNRFIVHSKLFARNCITVAIAIKRSMTEQGEETTVRVEFEPTDTIADIARRMNEVISSNKSEDAENKTDVIAKIFGFIPAFLIRFIVAIIRWLDNIGKLPRWAYNASPFHSSFFITNLGSLGIGPIYHHLYEFGTCSLFLAMGNKTRVHTISETGEREIRRFIGVKANTDERICDGLYYATSMKLFRHLLLHPEELLAPPETVVVDDGVGKPRIDGK